MRRNRGGTLIEYLISLVLSSVVIGAAFWMYSDSTSQAHFVDRYNDAESNARQQVDLLLDHVRNAQSCKDAGQIAISAGTATSLSYYGSNSTSDVIMYSLSGTDLVRTANSASKTVLDGVSSLEFTYYVISSGALVTTANANVPTSSELPSLAAVEVTAKADVDGIERELSGLVRLRNSPYKSKL
jgi:Tfp pilus assembly protein PilW